MERHPPNNDERLEGTTLRLVDADELYEQFKDKKSDTEEERDFNQIGRYLVKHAPTVETAPVVHGHWESFTTSAFIGMDEDGKPKWADRRFFVHKQCGRRSAIKEKYCPNCADKMDL